MHRLFSTILLVPLLFFVSQSASADTGKGVQFKDITITTSNTHLLLFGIIANHQTDDMEKALHSGIPMQFSFNIELFRTRDNWPDEELINMEFTHILRYDTLKEQYLVELEEKKNRVVSFQTFREAMTMMDEINGLKVVELSRLIPDSSYELRIKANLYEKTLPMNLHIVVPFVSLWNVETDWYTIEFTY